MNETQICEEETSARVRIDGGCACVDGLVVDDAVVVEHLAGLPADQRAAELGKALSIGVRGLVTMTAGASVKAIGSEVERVLGAVTDEAEARVHEIIEAGREGMRGEFDPERRSSLTARTIHEVSQVHSNLLDELDPERRGSHVGRLMAELTTLFGPGGALAQRLDETFDLSAADSAMAQVMNTMDGRFQEIRDLVLGTTSRSEEAERGTAKGVDFEAVVETQLRHEAERLGSCIVERTGRTPGKLAADAMVGDFAVTLGSGARVAIEVKNTARVDLNGAGGILSELDRAMVNRDAGWAICVSHHPAYPGEVGTFGVYGNRVLIAADDDGTLLRVALRWVDAAEVAAQHSAGGVDREAVLGRLDRIQELAARFGRTKRALTNVRRGVDDIKTEIDDLRTQLLDLVGEARLVLTAPEAASPAVKVA